MLPASAIERVMTGIPSLPRSRRSLGEARPWPLQIDRLLERCGSRHRPIRAPSWGAEDGATEAVRLRRHTDQFCWSSDRVVGLRDVLWLSSPARNSGEA
jgi:hypothetical protein